MGQLNVKAGDKVLMIGGYTYNHYEQICTVKKVTPTGRIRIKGLETQFDKFGYAMGRGNWDAPCFIKPITDDEEKEIREKWRKNLS